jgi:hypothetical protein
MNDKLVLVEDYDAIIEAFKFSVSNSGIALSVFQNLEDFSNNIKKTLSSNGCDNVVFVLD